VSGERPRSLFGCPPISGYLLKIALREITKRFPGGVVANDRVSIEGLPGEIHAILGENGAGKTTAMKVLAGFYRPDSGVVEIDGKRCDLSSPRVARASGIGMVHQHFSLVKAMTVAENLALVRRSPFLVFNPSGWSAKLADEAKRAGFRIRLDARIADLSMGERQRVEIFRLLLEGARVLILDEPTSILAPSEAQHLFEHLQHLAQSGCVVFLVTHKLDHVRAVADTVTVMRRGRVVRTAPTASMTDEELVELLVGREFVPTSHIRSDRSHNGGPPVLEVENLCSGHGRDANDLRGVSLSLRPGEILGVAGFGGNGQDALIDAITGTGRYRGQVKAPRNSRDRVQVALIPGDRLGTGIAPSLDLADNLNLRNFTSPRYSMGPFLRTTALANAARGMVDKYDIRPVELDVRAGTLSGGNLQKVLLARELQEIPRLLVAANPTAGLDIATVDLVHSHITRFANQGVAILLISEDLDELMLLSDRIVVLFEGKIVARFETSEFDASRIGAAMSGILDSEDEALESIGNECRRV
jgi:general nucleoside transport system ATP-binding protein